LDAALAYPIRFTVSTPKEHSGKLPAVLILGGLEIGRQSLGYLAHHGRNALLAYQYPGEGEAWYQGPWARRIPDLRKAALEVPAQVEIILAWIRAQAWAEPERISLMGYSFGAMFLPACLRLAQAHGWPLRSTVIAYGGAGLPALLEQNLDLEPRWLRRLAARLLALALRPLEPARHGPYLRGEFLFINGKRDTLIPPAHALALQTSVPGAHQVVWLEAGHMNPGDPLLLAQIIRLSRGWLVERKALEP
jgi:dienelactone hydrolase